MSLRETPDFKVRIYRDNNAVSVTKTESGILSTIQNNGTKNEVLVVSNTKQLVSYHLLRIISDSFNYVDKDIYAIINNYVNNLELSSFINDAGGSDALKLNIMAEVYKLSELLYYYGKSPLKDMGSIKEEVEAVVDKIFRTLK